ncbi:Cro/CI family transcriptional regulator [Stutzerimonas degradans]
MTPAQAAKKAAQILGSQAELARRLQIRTPTVSQWCSGARPVPAARALQIESAVDGKVSRQELCPSFPWEVMAA